MPWTQDVALELEALQATYGEELQIDEANQLVSMLLTPLGDASASYVQCQLQLSIPKQYPETTAPNTAVQEAKGLGSSRLAALEKQLHDEASQLAGEMMLGQLYECAKDWLKEHNWPEGPCIFCLEELSPNTTTSSSSSSSSTQLCMRLPCFHAFHRSCFSDWWCWQQQALLAQQQQLEQRTGATAAAALVQEQLPAKEGQHFQLTCPSCRTAFSLQQDLQHMLEQLQQNLEHQQQVAYTPNTTGNSSSSSSQHKLTAAELAPWRNLQQRHAALFAAQQKRNGIITDASYSIADWDSAAAAAAASVAATEQAAQARDRSSSTNSSNSSSSLQAPSSSKCMQRQGHGQQQLPVLEHSHEHSINNSSSGDGLKDGGSNRGAGRRGPGTSSSSSRHSRGRGRESGSIDSDRFAPAVQEHTRMQTDRSSSSSRSRGRGRGRATDGASSDVHHRCTGPLIWVEKDDSSRHDHRSGGGGNQRGRGRNRGRGWHEPQQHTSAAAGQ